MSIPNNMFRHLTFRCIRIAMLVLGVLAVFSLLISQFVGNNPEDITAVATQALTFPENEEMLQDITTQLQHEGTPLPEVTPAAGPTQ